jgi:phosphatidylinositol glycan class C protein
MSFHPPSTAGNSALFASAYGSLPPYDAPAPLFSLRTQQRLATAKSALLIYAALLGLSPVLKSLTKSTSSDSIWAMSSWLICINVFFFDYGGGAGPGSGTSTGAISGAGTFPASLSTNAALMASTVLASRLPSTTHVFSLTLFSIEVFGLFPVFRRHLRHRSWNLHAMITILLIMGAGAGLGVTLVGDSNKTWKAAVLGVVVWGLGTALAMGGCSWWLIGLQRYKNVVIGPWDPARPVIRAGGWE